GGADRAGGGRLGDPPVLRPLHRPCAGGRRHVGDARRAHRLGGRSPSALVTFLPADVGPLQRSRPRTLRAGRLPSARGLPSPARGPRGAGTGAGGAGDPGPEVAAPADEPRLCRGARCDGAALRPGLRQDRRGHRAAVVVGGAAWVGGVVLGGFDYLEAFGVVAVGEACLLGLGGGAGFDGFGEVVDVADLAGVGLEGRQFAVDDRGDVDPVVLGGAAHEPYLADRPGFQALFLQELGEGVGVAGVGVDGVEGGAADRAVVGVAGGDELVVALRAMGDQQFGPYLPD